MELCKSYYGLLLISLIYFQNEVRSKICKQSVESPYGSVRKSHPGALADKFPHKSDGVARYRDLYDLITETIYRNSKSTESASFHQDIKIYSEYKLPKKSRRHLNMIMKGDKEELIDLANLEREHFIHLGHKDESMHRSRNDKNIANYFKYAKFHYSREIFPSKSRKRQMSIENIPESSTVIKNKDRGTKFTMRIAKENDSIQELKNLNDTKKSPLFRILFRRYPNKYLLKRKRDDSHFFLRLQNPDDENRKRQRITLDPFWPRATPFAKRRKTIQPNNLFKMQNVSTKIPTSIHFAPKEKIPKRKSKNKSHFKNPNQFKGFDSSVQKKIPILFADLSSKNVGKMSGTEYSENTDRVRITLEEQMEETLSNGVTEEKTESSFSTNQALSNENMAPENLEVTETDNSSPLHHTVEVKNATGAKPESTEGVSSSPKEQAIDKISTENSESTAADINSPTDHFNGNEDRTETESESVQSKDNTQIDQFNSTQNTDIENTDTEIGNSLSTEGPKSSPKVQATDKIPIENSESTASVLNSATDHLNENEDKTETKSESIKSIDNTTKDQFNNAQNTYIANTDTEIGNSLSTDQPTVLPDTDEANTKSREENSDSTVKLASDNTSAESSEFREVDNNSQTNQLSEKENIFETKSELTVSENSSSEDQSNSKGTISVENWETTEAGTTLPKDKTASAGNTSETNSEAIAADNISSEALTIDNISAKSLENIHANTTESAEIIYRGYESNSSLRDKLDSKENTPVDDLESTKAGNGLLTNQTTTVENTSQTNIDLKKAESSIPERISADKTSIGSLERIKANITTATDIVNEHGANSLLTDQSNSKGNISAEKSEYHEAADSLPSNQATTPVNTSETNSKEIEADNSSPKARTPDNSFVLSSESIKVNTTDSTERIYRDYEANSSLTEQFNSKANMSSDNLEFREIDKNMTTNRSAIVGNTFETNSKSRTTENSFTPRMIANNISTVSIEFIKLNTTERMYRGYEANSSLIGQSNDKGIASTENSESKDVGNSLHANQTTEVGNMSERKPESMAETNSFLERLVTGNTSKESLEYNVTFTKEKIYGNYGVNGSRTTQFDSKRNTSVENPDFTEASNNLPTSQTIRVGSTSQRKPESINAESSFSEKLAADNTSAKSLEFINTNIAETTEIIYRGYRSKSSLRDKLDSKENTPADDLESTKAGDSLLTNQTTRVENTSQTNTDLKKAESSIPERISADKTSTGSLERLKANLTTTTDIVNEHGAITLLTDQSNSKGNTSAEKSESNEATNSLPSNQITTTVNTSKTNSKEIAADSSSPEARTPDNSFVQSSESIKVNTTDSSERIYRDYEANSSLTDQFNSKANMSSDNLEFIEIDKNLTTNRSTLIGNTFETNSKSRTTENSFTRRMIANNTSTVSIEFIKLNTTEATERMYRGYEANSSLIGQSNDKGIASTENSESKDVGNSLHTNQTIEIRNMFEKTPESIAETNSFLERLVTGNTSKESLEYNVTFPKEKIYGDYGVNGSRTTQFDSKRNTSVENPDFTEASNNLPTSQTIRVGSTSRRKPESINAESSFFEKLAADNTPAVSLEFINTNTAETTEIIYRGYRSNSSLTGLSNKKENKSTENSDTIVVGSSSSTNQIIQVGSISEMKLKSLAVANNIPGRLVTDKTSAESLESIKFDTIPSVEKIYSGYVANSSLIGKANSEENISAENSESTVVGNSLPTNQTTRVKKASEMNAKLIAEDKSFPGRNSADNSTAEGSDSMKNNSTDSTDWIYSDYKDNSSKLRNEGNKSDSNEKTFIDSSEHIKVVNSIPERGNTSPTPDNSSPSENKSSVVADSKSAEADTISPLQYDLHKISPTEHYRHKISPLSSNRNEGLDKENLKSLNRQA